MSSRALRKAQRELEQKKQLEELEREAQTTEEESEDDVNDEPVKVKGASMFALLGSEVEEDGDHDTEAKDPTIDDASYPSEPEAQLPGKARSSKKKKKKAKAKAKAPHLDQGPGRASEPRYTPAQSNQLDEIDLALRSLSTKDNQVSQGVASAQSEASSPEQIELHGLLAVETQHLQAANEMRKLFGRAALERDEDEGDGAARRRGRQQVGLAGAVAVRNTPGGRNLASLGLRRNVFVQGKEDWPRAATGGLGMEVVEKRKDGTVEYKFVHNSFYQDVQRQFQTCVLSMDPNRMVQLLQLNPFHISTLLQVSEIAKHERDRATSGDLLERALFAFGRAVYSTFSSNLSKGKARLDFRRPENREFWLAGWRYVAMLGQRATWRTAFEWSQLLLSLDPDRDPYCVSLAIDQLALRGRQPKKLIDLWSSKHFHSDWHRLPNVSMSIGLAYAQHGEPQLARSFLKDAIEQYPWVAMRLFQELELQPIPPSIWGKQPRSDTEQIFMEMYVIKAKDIWNTPEATTLLMEVASTAQPKSTPDVSIYTNLDELSYSRHILLTDDQNLIGMLDRSMTSRLTSVSDPLPPQDSLSSYAVDVQRPVASTAAARTTEGVLASAQEMLTELTSLQAFFSRVLPWVQQPGEEGQPARVEADGEQPTPEDLERRLQESGIDPQTIIERTERMQQLQQGIQDLMAEAELQVQEAQVDAERG